jgi:hypothetical protein
MHHKHNKWTETLALETQKAISNLDITEQNYYGHAVAINIYNINQIDNATNKRNKEEWQLTTNIKNKVIINELTLAKADNRKTLAHKNTYTK